MTGSGSHSHATSGATDPISIFLLDDHEVVRRGCTICWTPSPT